MLHIAGQLAERKLFFLACINYFKKNFQKHHHHNIAIKGKPVLKQPVSYKQHIHKAAYGGLTGSLAN